MTKYTDRGYKQPADIPISLPNYEYENRVYYCDTCKRNLVKLIDSSGQNPSWYCNHCSIETFPTEEIRSRSKLQTPDGPIEEPGITHLPEVGIKRKQKEEKGGILELKRRRMKITHYKEGKG
jgi:hypothetical protein